MRHYKLYIGDILEAISRIEKYTKGFTPSRFQKNTLVADAVIRNLAIIGEAVKSISSSIKKNYEHMEWKKIAGLRDILIHAYAGIDLEIIWDVIENKLKDLKYSINKILNELK